MLKLAVRVLVVNGNWCFAGFAKTIIVFHMFDLWFLLLELVHVSHGLSDISISNTLITQAIVNY